MSQYINILIADDDEDDAAFLNEGISQLISAYKVYYAKDGGECLHILKNNPAPEIIFLDLKLPLRSGMECLKIMRNNSLLETTPIIIYSSSHNISDIDKCFKLGANFYIVKPASLASMVDMLNQLFIALGEPKATVRSKDKFVLMSEPELIK